MEIDSHQGGMAILVKDLDMHLKRTLGSILEPSLTKTPKNLDINEYREQLSAIANKLNEIQELALESKIVQSDLESSTLRTEIGELETTISEKRAIISKYSEIFVDWSKKLKVLEKENLQTISHKK